MAQPPAKLVGQLQKEITGLRQRIKILQQANTQAKNAAKAKVTIDRFHHPLRVRIITWNVGNAPPSSLTPLLAEANEQLIVFGVQECVWEAKYSSKSFGQLIDKQLGDHYYHLETANIMGDDQSLERFDPTKTGGLRLFIYAQRHLRKHIKKVKIHRENTGAASIWHNKGGVGISLRLFKCKLMFVNSHLAAHRENIKDRDHDAEEIAQSFSTDKTSFIHRYDYCFWMGDLNYRLDLPREEVLPLIADEKWLQLQAMDQLNRQRRDLPGYVLSDFEELPTNFAPTFKRNRDGPGYESTKMRVPSWCDRVLYRVRPGRSIKPSGYGVVEEVVSSDHRPVVFTAELMLPLPYAPVPQLACRLTITDLKLAPMFTEDDAKVTKFKSAPVIHLKGPFLERSLRCQARGQELIRADGDASWQWNGEDVKRPPIKSGRSGLIASVVGSKSACTPTGVKWPSRIELYPYLSEKSYLSEQALRLSLYDTREEGRYLQTTIGLLLASTQLGKPVPFETLLVCYDEERYRLTGQLTIEYQT